MRIVVIGGWAPSLIKFRGPLLAAMVARGHEVVAMAPEADALTRERLAALGVTLRELELQRTGTDPRADLRAIVSLVALLRELRPDVVLAYTIKPLSYGMLAAWIAGVPRRVALITGLGYAFAEHRSMRGRVINAIASRLYRAALQRSQTIFFQNADDRDELGRRGLLPSRAHIEIVRGSGVDLSYFTPAPLPDGPTTFLFVGRLLRDKGLLEYVEAARRVRRARPDVVFRILGWLDPNPESVSQRDLDQWASEGIVYLGQADDVRPFLGACHVLVLPSYREGTPRSVLEAMATGRAVITTDVPGCRDTIVHDESGLLIPVRDPAALASAMQRLIDEPATLTRLAEEGRRRVVELYDAGQIAVRMLDVLDL